MATGGESCHLLLSGQEEAVPGGDLPSVGPGPQDVQLPRVQGRPQAGLQEICQVRSGGIGEHHPGDHALGVKSLYKARESSLVPRRLLTFHFLQKT